MRSRTHHNAKPAPEPCAAEYGLSSAPPSPADDFFVQFTERTHMINRIHMALRSTLQLEDIYTIILATLVTRRAMDFSRGLLFGYDEKRQAFRGLSALGADSSEDHDRLQREISEEESALATMVETLNSLDDAQDEERLFSQSLRELSDHSYWITTFQKYSENNPIEQAVREIEIPFKHQSDIAEPHRMNFIERVAAQDACVLCTRDQLKSPEIPDRMANLIEETSLWSTIKTHKGVRLLLVTDKAWQPEPISHVDALRLDWFSSQIALALENAEMFHDLESAFNSLREMDMLKSNFLSTISHELRTPLTAITGFLQLLLNNKIGQLPEPQRDILARMMGHTDHLSSKVNDLIEIAEMDAGLTNESELDEVDPLEVIVTALNRVEKRREQKKVTVEPDLKETVPSIRSNAEALGRIIYHLLDNAIKFSPIKGRIELRFEREGDALGIAVKDYGIGIDPSYQQKIFDAFFQVDSNLTRSYEGMGIGLTIIKRQLDLTGGWIHLESEPESGSTFTVFYPIA